MQPYMSSYPNQMNMNQANMGMYQGFNQPMNNPYIDRMNQLQQYQQSLQIPAQQQQLQQMPVGINGKVVPSVENITANDVPMDGSVAFFPRQDMTEIYAKSWNADGTIKTVVYKPFMDNPNNLPQGEEKFKIGLSEDVTAAFMQRFDDIADRIEKLEKSMNNPVTKSNSSRSKKEANTDE